MNNAGDLCDHNGIGCCFTCVKWDVFFRSYWLHIIGYRVHGGRAVDSTPPRASYGRTDNAPLYLPGGFGRWCGDAVPLMPSHLNNERPVA